VDQVVLVALAIAAVLLILVVWLLNAFIFYATGRAVSTTETTMSDALFVALLGALVNSTLQWGFQWILVPMIPPVPLAPYLGIAAVIGAALITLIIYLPLIMKFFEMRIGEAVFVGVVVSIFNVFISGIILVITI
jgi:hypothetical protein